MCSRPRNIRFFESSARIVRTQSSPPCLNVFYDVDYDCRNELVKNKKKRKRKKKREEIVNEEPINEPRMHVAFLRKIFLCPNLHKYIRSRVYVLVTALIRACVY